MKKPILVREYSNFDLWITHRHDGTYSLRGQDDLGSVTERDDVILPPELLEVTTTSIIAAQEDPSQAAEGGPARGFGEALFRAVFQDELLDQLNACLRDARNPGHGIRLRLRLDKAPELASLPWELLYDPGSKTFFGHSMCTPVVRYLELPQRHEPLECQPPLKILAVLSCPRDLEQLDVEGEWKRLRDALQPLEEEGLLTLERLQPPTFEALQKAVHFPPHVLHFVGHGGLEESTDDVGPASYLCFENSSGFSHRVSGRDLGAALFDGSLRLATLNCCYSATPTANSPTSGIAEDLLRQKVSAVLGLAAEIEDSAALTLTSTFYGALADGLPVDACLADARKAMAAGTDDLTWALPRLFLRSHDGVLFRWPYSRRGRFWQRFAVGAILLITVILGAGFLADQRLTRTVQQHNTRALEMVDSERFDDARREIASALTKAPGWAETWSNLGTLEIAMGHSDEALEAFRQAVELAPESALHHFNLGSQLLNAGLYEEALRHLRRAVDLNPNDGDAMNNLAWTYLETQRLDAARSWLAKGLALESLAPQTRAALHKNYGRLSFESGDAATAVIHLQEALRTLDPSYPGLRLEALLYLAESQGALGDHEMACSTLRQLVDHEGLLYRWSRDPQKLAQQLACEQIPDLAVSPPAAPLS